MNESIQMSVSSISRSADKKAVYVLFKDGNAFAEFEMPEIRLISNNGFSEENIICLKDYIKANRDMILDIAKTVNPIKGFMK